VSVVAPDRGVLHDTRSVEVDHVGRDLRCVVGGGAAYSDPGTNAWLVVERMGAGVIEAAELGRPKYLSVIPS
jgi:hypothetical protein